jgi:hypothetical protein
MPPGKYLTPSFHKRTGNCTRNYTRVRLKIITGQVRTKNYYSLYALS